MDYFINRDEEIQAFKDALNDLFKGTPKTTVLLYHGASGMGKTWLLQKCLRIAREDSRKPVIIHVDCNRANMTLEVLFNEIHSALEADFKKYYTAYIEFLEKIDDIEDQVDEEGKTNPENAQKVASVVSSVATKVVAATVPGATAVVGEENLGKAAGLVAGGIAEGITSLRRNFARRKLDREKYRFFLKDLQAERTKKLADTLNTIAEEHNRKIILYVDRFEKFAITPNPKSDTSYYQYWRKDFVNKLSPNILLLQGGRTDLEGDYQLHLPDHRVRSFRLKAFTEKDISRIFSQLQNLRQQMQKYEQFVKDVFEKTQGYPVAMGLLKGNLQTLRTTGEFERINQEISAKETDIIEHKNSRTGVLKFSSWKRWGDNTIWKRNNRHTS